MKDDMKIGFDLSQIAHPGGVANYTYQLAKGLCDSNEIEVCFFYSSLRKSYKKAILEVSGEKSQLLKNIKTFRLPPTLFEVLFNKMRNVNIERFIGDIDIFHSSDWVQPPSKAKKITTYHDIVPLRYPNWSHPKIVEVHKRRLEIVEREIDLVIAVSEATKKDLVEISKIPEDKIVVIYEACDDSFKPQPEAEVEKFKKKMNLPDDYILAIGGIGERRNLVNIKKACSGRNLVVTGETIPYVEKKELPLLYAGALVLMYPSFYEGFGLPILEAQSCGVPVITSNISSMPEIAGEGAVLVNPHLVKEMSNAINEVTSNKKLRENLIKNGYKNTKRFSWKKCAEDTINAYKMVGK